MARATPFHVTHPTTGGDEIPLLQARRIQLGDTVVRGNVGTVYRARLESDGRVRRPVALKIFEVVSSDDREVVLPRLARLARHAAYVQHPNVVDVYEFGVLGNGQPFLVMELVAGESLSGLMEAYSRTHRRFPLDLGLFVGTEVAEALVGARRASTPEGRRVGFAHGDLSAREVLFSWHGEVKVSDFGVARAVGVASTVRRIAMLARRVATVAPEVAQGQRDDGRSDVFSLGILLHEMMIGPRFPEGMPDAEKLDRARSGYVHSSVFCPQLPDALRNIILRAIAIDPDRRYPHAGVLAYELRRAALEMGVGDGRVFLRSAMDSLLDQTAKEALLDGASDEVPATVRPANDATPPGAFGEDEEGGGEQGS